MVWTMLARILICLYIIIVVLCHNCINKKSTWEMFLMMDTFLNSLSMPTFQMMLYLKIKVCKHLCYMYEPTVVIYKPFIGCFSKCISS